MSDSKETSVTVKVGLMVTLGGSLLVFLLATLMSHERRVTVLETNNATVISILTEIKGDLKSHLNTPCKTESKK